MKLLLLAAISATPLFAGELNIVHLGPPEHVRVKIACDGTEQEVELAHGGTTGQFILPEKEATIRLPGTQMPELRIPGNTAKHVAILRPAAEGFRWLLIDGKPTNEKWSMRVINLTGEAIVIARDEERLEVMPDTPTVIPVAAKKDVAIQIVDGVESTYQGSEPSAVLALVHRKGDGLDVLFVVDH